jgi:O-methyltransferase
MFFNKIYRKLMRIIAAPFYLSYFFDKDVGCDYKLGFLDKVNLIFRFRKNSRRIVTATNWLEHLRIASEILKIPASKKGDIIECGCFKGSSSTNLSIICDIVGRKLIICDSFEGLPDLDDSDKVHYIIYNQQVREYEKGHFTGGIEEVKNNISKYGKISVCKFVKGYYKDTLKHLDGSYILAFIDVDLYKSLEECLEYLWPRLTNGAYLFSHEAQDIPYISLFFDTRWWEKKLNCACPGFVGAGVGLPLGIGEGSNLGYAVKGDISSFTKDWDTVSYNTEFGSVDSSGKG